ncbi:AopD protein [Pseudomonas aeruginosa]|uniref:type III secretion system translocon subunit PopD n=1 Tax=Pseudomonas aeruginosa TaxID=287 RepID=UPI000F894A1A|nr:type III secretion system translocon subunit PopD [Pseudomonas aeruginosa]RTT24905.1 AopD protein [Pseudomonas aeruginosa]
MIDTQYSLAATQAAIPSEPIAPGAAGRSVGTPQAAADLPQVPAARADRVELSAPRQVLDPVRMEAAGSELDSSVELLLILFRIAQKARELGVLQRDNENQSIIHAQKAQVDEMRSGATLMIAMAVIAGVGALASAVVGSLGALKNGKAISQEKTLQKNIDGRNELIDAKMQALGKTSDEDRKIVGKVWAADQVQDSVALRAAGRAFESRNGALQVANTVIQSFVQMANASVQVRQGESQASAREEEVNATIGQSQKQKVEDQMSFDAGFMKDVLQLIQQYTQSHNQAWRAAAGVV